MKTSEARQAKEISIANAKVDSLKKAGKMQVSTIQVLEKVNKKLDQVNQKRQTRLKASNSGLFAAKTKAANMKIALEQTVRQHEEQFREYSRIYASELDEQKKGNTALEFHNSKVRARLLKFQSMLRFLRESKDTSLSIKGNNFLRLTKIRLLTWRKRQESLPSLEPIGPNSESV